jgi:indolepyruvate ferredoxin oxidoreductase alpha subunit
VFNNDDGVLVIMKNGYTSATGTQEIPSSATQSQPHRSGEMTIERTLEGLGVKWMKTVYNYKVGNVLATLREAMSTPYSGLKVIVADAECIPRSLVYRRAFVRRASLWGGAGYRLEK